MKNRVTTSLLMLLVTGTFCLAQELESKPIELHRNEYSLIELMQELREHHNISLAYSKLPVRNDIHFKQKQITLKVLMQKALQGTGYSYRFVSNKVLIVAEKKLNSGHKINGFIREASSGEALIGATIYDHTSGRGTTSNQYGFYSLSLPANAVVLEISFLGFNPAVKELLVTSDQELNFDLVEAETSLQDVTITSSKDRPTIPVAGTTTLSSGDLSVAPMVLGEPDLLRSIQLLPGIKSGVEGTTGLYVRGGNADQNLFLMDGVPIYNTSHVFGFLSMFNPETVRSVNVVKGGFPARYGGRLSSVVDISIKEGNMKKIKGSAAVGLIAANATVEGPIKKDRSSFLISARRTYFDALVNPFVSEKSGPAAYNLLDFNAKINHRFSSKDRIYFSMYGGRDKLGESSISTVTTFDPNGPGTSETRELASNIRWGNLLAIGRWNHVFSPVLFANTSILSSRYHFITSEERASGDGVESLEYRSGIHDLGVKVDLDYYPMPGLELKFGGAFTHHAFNTGVINYSEFDALGNDELETQPAHEYTAYIENIIDFSSNLRVNVGGHFSNFVTSGKSYQAFQPRIIGQFTPFKNWTFSASYSEMAQFIHLLVNSGIGLPTDLWVPATDIIRPQESRQFAMGVSKPLNGFEVSIEGYFKEMNHVIEYENGASYLHTSTNWEEKVTVGNGESYGLELLVKKKSDRFNGWLSYNWSKSTRQFDELNNGQPFPFRYDRRHDGSITGTYQLKPHVTLSATWVYTTGSAVTLPSATYSGWYQNVSEVPLMELEHIPYRNNFRMRDFHRADASISWDKRKKRGVRTWSLGVYNLYNRKNPFAIFVDDRSSDGTNPQLFQISVFHLTPFINYSFKF